MNDLCLINLPKPFLTHTDAQFPSGVLYLAAVAEQHGYTVALANLAQCEDVTQAIPHVPPARLYGITATALEVHLANEVAAQLALFTDSPVVLGGPGVLAPDAINRRVIPTLSYGDGEATILTMLQDLPTGVQPEYHGVIQDINALPFPARHLLGRHQGGDIFAFSRRYADGPTTNILSSRGCAFQCAFCAAPRLSHPYETPIRYRIPASVAHEIRVCKDAYGIRQFRFSDDMFTASKARTLALCEAIGPEHVFWRVSCRVHPLDDEMLRAMYQAGCREVSFGIESFDDAVLHGLNKRTTAATNARALELAAKHGLVTRALLMIRTPFQTPSTIQVNKDYLRRVPWDIAACTAFVPLPGCDIWDHPARYGITIVDRDLSKYNFYMYDRAGRRTIDRIFTITTRDGDTFHRESEEFRDWLESTGKVNPG